MASGFACYHHCNDLDRPAVAPCSKCGKSLCVECTDLFRSKKTGNILCIECLNKEIKGNENRFAAIAERRKQEMNKMIAGAVVGAIAAIVLLIAAGGIGVLGLWLPFLFASFGLIWEKSFGSKGWLIGAIVFVVMAAISPIMFVVRLKSRADQRKVLAEAIAHNQYMRQLNDKYLTQARQKKSGLTSASIQELLNKTAALQKKEEEVAKRMEQAQASGDNSQVEALRKELESVKAQAAEAKATADDAKQNSVSNEEMEKALAAFESNVSGALNDLEGKGKAKSRKSA